METDSESRSRTYDEGEMVSQDPTTGQRGEEALQNATTSTSATPSVIIVNNAQSGYKKARELMFRHIIPALYETYGTQPEAKNQKELDARIEIQETKCAGDGVRIGREIFQRWYDAPSRNKVLDIVLMGGDGTTSEFLNGWYGAQLDFLKKKETGEASLVKLRLPRLRLAIVPCGTANALFSAMYPSVDPPTSSSFSVEDESSNGLLSSFTALLTATKLNQGTPSTGNETLSRLYELPLMLNGLMTHNPHHHGNNAIQTSFSHLVTSHALHAAILHDADTEEMRKQYSGIERFKIAAERNVIHWVDGTVTLYGVETENGRVLRYEPRSKNFEPYEVTPTKSSGNDAKDGIDPEEGDVVLEGPFIYLNAMVVDRLEPRFVPAPLSSPFTQDSLATSRVPSSSTRGLPRDAIDVVLIRPTRDPSVSARLASGSRTRTSREQEQEQEQEVRLEFAKSRLGEITAGMYNGGSHIDLTYPSPASGVGKSDSSDRATETESKGKPAEPIVEYYRCSGYTFTPHTSSERGEGNANDKANLICMDGTIDRADQFRVRRWNPKTDPLTAGIQLPLVWK